MWNDYSHDSIESFFKDFMKEYSEEFLINNCSDCYKEMSDNGSTIIFEDLFDILLRRLVIDAFIGFKAEDIIREKLIKNGYKIHDYAIISKEKEAELDTKYGIDIMTFNNDKVSTLIQVKNTSTFSHNGSYIKDKRKEFIDKEYKANKFIDDGENRSMQFYIYDKNAYIKEKRFKYYVNPRTDKCFFSLSELIMADGSLKTSVQRLRSREL